MKKFLLLAAFILLAFTFNPGSNITGFLIQAASTMVTIARFVIKEVLSFFIKVL